MNIFLSPHPDDVIWSCGDLIISLLSNKKPVKIITLFDGEEEMGFFNKEQWRNVANPEIRIKENKQAMEYLSLKNISFHLNDASLRKDSKGQFIYSTIDEIFKKNHSENEKILQFIIRKLKEFHRENYIYYAPLGIGNHIDHIITRRAILNINPSYLYWYREFPYDHSLLKENFQESLPLSEDIDYDKWIKICLFYKSQIRYIFKTYSEFKKQHLLFIQKRGYCL